MNYTPIATVEARGSVVEFYSFQSSEESPTAYAVDVDDDNRMTTTDEVKARRFFRVMA